MLSKERLSSISVGDTLWIGGGGLHVVVSVGRKYFHVAPVGKTPTRYNTAIFTLEDGRHFRKDGFGGKLAIYDTEGDWRRKKEADIAWDKLKGWFIGKYAKPIGLTTEAINEVLTILQESEVNNGNA